MPESGSVLIWIDLPLGMSDHLSYLESLRSISPHTSNMTPRVNSSWLSNDPKPAVKSQASPGAPAIVDPGRPTASQPDNPKAVNPLPATTRTNASFLMACWGCSLKAEC